MFSGLENKIQAMSSSDYLFLLAGLAAVTGYLLYYCYKTYRRYRFMDGTATSKIRSAAQGYVELKGLGEWLPSDSIISPFSKSRCVWYHCTIDKRERSGKRTTWTNISDECSEHLFRLVDDTGSCIIDPDHAHVIPESDVTWYGSGLDSQANAPRSNSLIRLGTGRYRFRERLIRPASNLYALGWFRTTRTNPSNELIAARVEDLIKQWKLQPHRYLARFDLDKNGKIQKQEWGAVRAAARSEVLARMNKEVNEHHVLGNPNDGKHPFILSATLEEDLVPRKKLMAATSLSIAFLVFVALVIMSSIRSPFTV